MKKKFNRQQLQRLLRPSLEDWVMRGEPSEEEYRAKEAEIASFTDDVRRTLQRQSGATPDLYELEERLDRLEEQVAALQRGKRGV